MAKKIKVEWCENFIESKFKKLPEFVKGFETNCFFKMAAEAELYIPGTYGSPMSEALENLTEIKTVYNDNNEFLYHAFHLKK